MKTILAMAVAPMLLLAGCADAGSEQGDGVSVAADEQAQLEANKQLVLDMWHTVLNGQNFDAAGDYIAQMYFLHSPDIASGLDCLL